MYNFVTLMWNTRDSRTTQEATRLVGLLQRSTTDIGLVLSIAGLAVFAAKPNEKAFKPYVLPRRSGVVLGRLFRAKEGAMTAEVQIDDAAAAGIVGSGGARLVDDYWGAYVAFLFDETSLRQYVVRDCSGWLPCYRTTFQNVEIMFSDLRDLLALQLPPFTFNYQYIAAAIYAPLVCSRDCGFSEVTEILAGECLEFTESSIRQFSLWDPAQVVRRRTVEDPRSAEVELRTTTQACIDAWSTAYSDDNVLLALSGGLDSAIVLGTLKRAPRQPGLICFNQCISDTEDDERRYARVAAARSDVRLVELPWSDVHFGEHLFAVPKGPKPYPGDIYWWLERSLRNGLAEDTGARAIWTGQGGDHLFWALGNFPVAADYVTLHGITFGLLRVIRDAARVSGQSYASVFNSARRISRSDRPWMADEANSMRGHFVNRDALPPAYDQYILHPWCLTTTSLPKAKAAQIALLAEVLNRHQHLPRAEVAYQRHPLLAQPLMELCLQIPGYTLIGGGRLRALARRAFSDRVPREILERSDKGSSVAHMRSMIRENGPFLCDLLLGGVLVQERVISSRQLAVILAEGQSYRPENLWSLLACIAMEIWARSWKSSTLRAAA